MIGSGIRKRTVMNRLARQRTTLQRVLYFVCQLEESYEGRPIRGRRTDVDPCYPEEEPERHGRVVLFSTN